METPLPVPSATRYQAHCRATLSGGHICLILTPNEEIKAFADGVQVFNFIGGRWHLTDAVDKYRLWDTLWETRNWPSGSSRRR